jgi:hypothetical protein
MIIETQFHVLWSCFNFDSRLNYHKIKLNMTKTFEHKWNGILNFGSFGLMRYLLIS